MEESFKVFLVKVLFLLVIVILLYVGIVLYFYYKENNYFILKDDCEILADINISNISIVIIDLYDKTNEYVGKDNNLNTIRNFTR